ncbi:MAG: hypothetical protein ACLUUO_18705 [Sellimonas intestinalis]
MAMRNILHISKLQEFEDFLETKGYMIVATSKNPFEVLRAQKDGDTVIVYQKKDTKRTFVYNGQRLSPCAGVY